MLAKCDLVDRIPASLFNKMQSGSSANNIISKMMTLPELAELLSVSPTTIYRMTEGRKIRFYKIKGSIRFRKEDVLAYMNANCYEPIK